MINKLISLIAKKELNADNVEIATKLIPALPQSYLDIFSTNRKNIEKIEFKDQDVLKRIKDNYDLWKSGEKNSLLVVGDYGCGKTALVTHLKTKVFISENVKNIHLMERVQNFNLFLKEQTLTSIHKDGGIIILDNIQYLFLKTYGGFDVLRTFLEYQQKTKDKLFWIVTSPVHCYAYINPIFILSEYFNEIIKLEGKSDNQLEMAILHNNAGHTVKFLPNKVDTKKTTKNAKDEYFEKLFKISGGNIAIAFKFWLFSIHKFEGKVLTVKQIDIYDKNKIERLDDCMFFIVEAILQHGSLALDELKRVLPEIDLSPKLQSLEEQEILSRNNEQYYLNIKLLHVISDQIISRFNRIIK